MGATDVCHQSIWLSLLSALSKLLHKINSDSNLGFRRLYSGDTDFLVLESLISNLSTHQNHLVVLLSLCLSCSRLSSPHFYSRAWVLGCHGNSESNQAGPSDTGSCHGEEAATSRPEPRWVVNIVIQDRAGQILPGDCDCTSGPCTAVQRIRRHHHQ